MVTDIQEQRSRVMLPFIYFSRYSIYFAHWQDINATLFLHCHLVPNLLTNCWLLCHDSHYYCGCSAGFHPKSCWHYGDVESWVPSLTRCTNEQAWLMMSWERLIHIKQCVTVVYSTVMLMPVWPRFSRSGIKIHFRWSHNEHEAKNTGCRCTQNAGRIRLPISHL